MKFSIITALAAGASLVQVGAVPLRVVMVSSMPDVPAHPNIRMGHPVAEHHKSMLTNVVLPAGTGSHQPARMRRPCGARLRQKAVEISNIFRQALGMPAIEAAISDKFQVGNKIHGNMIQIVPFVGTPPTFVEVKGTGGRTRGGDAVRILPVNNLPHPHPHPHPHFHHPHHQYNHHSHRSFLVRIQQALMSLGVWEGRAVAFVLGCGLGVLLRMMWVLAVVLYRSIRGEREEDSQYASVTMIEDDSEAILVPPPSYTYADEKAPVVVAEAPKAPAADNTN